MSSEQTKEEFDLGRLLEVAQKLDWQAQQLRILARPLLDDKRATNINEIIEFCSEAIQLHWECVWAVATAKRAKQHYLRLGKQAGVLSGKNLEEANNLGL